MRIAISHRAARALRSGLSSLAIAVYLAAAAMPCPPAASAIAGAKATVTNGTTPQVAHHGHGDRADAADTSHSHAAAVIAAPCQCGCGKRAGGAPTSRLAPVLPAESIPVAVACAVAPIDELIGGATSVALAPPTPVPISRFA